LALNSEKTVLIFAPMQKRAWVLPYYLRNLHNINYNKKQIGIYWILNNTESDNTEKLLREFKQKYEHEYKEIIIETCNNPIKMPKDDRTELTRKYYVYPWLVKLRNKGLAKCVELGYDYLFSSDSDILLTKEVINVGLSYEKDVVANLLYNGFLEKPESPYIYPNILKKAMFDSTKYTHINDERVQNKKGFFEVDFTGASIFISQEVCKISEYGVSTFFGEDLKWSRSVQNAGYKLWVSCDNYQQHVMSRKLLDKFKDFGI